MAKALEMRDPYTAGHQTRVKNLAVRIAEEQGMDPHRIEGLRLAASVHDLGKLHTPAEILNRPGRLSDPEMTLIRLHAEKGFEILSDVPFPWPIADIVHQHHERLDGTGYPLGLTGDDILEEAKILAVADVFEAITSHRPYRPGLGIMVALQEVRRGAGTIYDQTACNTLERLVTEEGAFWLEDTRSSH
jgi:putative nucleotidyltransferase with HDIG domain